MHLTGVDIDSEMIRLAKTWFGLDDTLSTCVIGDGIQFLQEKINEKGRDYRMIAILEYDFSEI